MKKGKIMPKRILQFKKTRKRKYFTEPIRFFNRSRLFKNIIIITFAICIVIFSIHHALTTFYSPIWKLLPQEHRFSMGKDIVDKKVLLGKSKVEEIETLGDKIHSEYQNEDGTTDVYYYLTRVKS